MGAYCPPLGCQRRTRARHRTVWRVAMPAHSTQKRRCVHACVRACVHACVHACLHAHTCTRYAAGCDIYLPQRTAARRNTAARRRARQRPLRHRARRWTVTSTREWSLTVTDSNRFKGFVRCCCLCRRHAMHLLRSVCSDHSIGAASPPPPPHFTP